MNELKNALTTYAYYLIHPFRTHADPEFSHLSIYESLGISWIFAVLNGLFRIVMVFGLAALVVNDQRVSSQILELFYEGDRLSGFYFVILMTILDVIFFPLINLFMIQFWEFIFKIYANLNKTDGDIDLKAKNTLAVALSPSLLLIIPIFGDMARSLARLVHLYAGLRGQFGFSRGLTVCVLLTPPLIFMMFSTVILTLAIAI